MKYFTVAINDDGSVAGFGAMDHEGNPLESDLSRYDIYKACKEIVLIVEQDMLVDGVMRSLIRFLTPADPTAEAKARMAETLKERNSDDVR